MVGTALYDSNDPGVHYNIYNDDLKPVYSFPGPALCEYFKWELCTRELLTLRVVTG